MSPQFAVPFTMNPILLPSLALLVIPSLAPKVGPSRLVEMVDDWDMTEIRGIGPLKLDEGVASDMFWIAAMLHLRYREEFGSGLMLCFGVTDGKPSCKGYIS